MQWSFFLIYFIFYHCCYKGSNVAGSSLRCVLREDKGTQWWSLAETGGVFISG